MSEFIYGISPVGRAVDERLMTEATLHHSTEAVKDVSDELVS